MGEPASLYEEDLVRWSIEQAAALRQAARSGTNLPIDWENVAEEIETMGRSQRHELRNRIRTLLRHLLKLACSQAGEPRRGWENTVRRTRTEIDDLIADSPSLAAERASILEAVRDSEADQTARELDALGETEAAAAVGRFAPSLNADRVFGDWMPARPIEEHGSGAQRDGVTEA